VLEDGGEPLLDRIEAFLLAGERRNTAAGPRQNAGKDTGGDERSAAS
jgi:hypothetical protein